MSLNGIRRRFELGGYTLVDKSARAISVVPTLLLRYRDFSFALAVTILFYLPALKHASVDAGFLYGGDVLGFYWPSLVKVHALISAFHFTAIDFSSFNGSADFFLTPNFFAVHPIFVGYSLFTSPVTTTVRNIGHLLVVAAAVHSFIACYFSLKLLVRFFGFNFGMACFAAMAFAFSVLMVNSLGEPEFIFCATLVPWAAYGALSFEQRPSLARLLVASMPVLLAYLGGYIPMGVASLALAAVLVGGRLLLLDVAYTQPSEKARSFIISLLPFIVGSLVASPYLYSVYTFLKQSPSANTASLFYSAHQLAEAPSALLRVISFNLKVPGAFYEFTATWGLLAITISSLFLLSRKTFAELTFRESTIFKFFAAIYFATMLAAYGSFGVVSDMVYYYVPQVGSMHIYQRFLVPANLLLGGMVAVMLKSLIQSPPLLALRIALVVLAIMTVAAAYVVGHDPSLTEALGINNYIVLELFLCCLFVLAMLFPGSAFIYSVAIALFSLPVLDRMYDYSSGGNTLAEQKTRQIIALDDAARDRLVTYLKRYSGKEIIKYVDTTPLWDKSGIETFPKQLPYLVLNELNLSSYGGFNFYLSTRADYMQRMPVRGVNELYPDWDYIANTGGDFLIAREADLRSGPLSNLIQSVDEKSIYRLPNESVVVPLKPLTDDRETTPSEGAFDNGYFRVSEQLASEPEAPNVARNKRATQSSTFSTADASRAVDGNEDGEFSHNSVSHTGKDSNAWLDIDLGAVENIGRVKIWNRTDCCGERLADYWLFISEMPFAKDDTADLLRARPGVWARAGTTPSPVSMVRVPNVRGRYVRVQLGGKMPDLGYLSLAEVEVFRATGAPAEAGSRSVITDTKFTTNRANYLRLDFEASKPAVIQYLLWSNPRLSYILNGKRVAAEDRSGTASIVAPAGHNTLEVVYRHWPLTVFWILYGLFMVCWLLAAGVLLVEQIFSRPDREVFPEDVPA